MKAQKEQNTGSVRHEVKYYIGEREACAGAGPRCVMSVDRSLRGTGVLDTVAVLPDTPDNRVNMTKNNGLQRSAGNFVANYDTAERSDAGS